MTEGQNVGGEMIAALRKIKNIEITVISHTDVQSAVDDALDHVREIAREALSTSKAQLQEGETTERDAALAYWARPENLAEAERLGFAQAPPADVVEEDAALLEQIDALLDLDAKGALVPHGVGGHARTLLTKAAKRIARPIPQSPDREKIARLIDPVSYGYRDKPQDGFHITSSLHARCDEDIEHALAKADNIISTFTSDRAGIPDRDQIIATIADKMTEGVLLNGFRATYCGRATAERAAPEIADAILALSAAPSPSGPLAGGDE